VETKWPLEQSNLRGNERRRIQLSGADIIVKLFRFKDRRETGYLLSPTHEEEITDLVANTIKSYKELPARLYQICK
jgi:prolyl-tRNA synthetase